MTSAWSHEDAAWKRRVCVCVCVHYKRWLLYVCTIVQWSLLIRIL